MFARSCLVCALVVLQLIAPGIARAGADDKAEARAHFKKGTAFLDAADYKHAIAEYQEAYRLYPNPKLHFNLGQAFRLDGQKQQALDEYRKFLEAQPIGAEADDARAYCALLERDLAPPPAPAPEPQQVVEPPPPPPVVTPAPAQPQPELVVKPVAEPKKPKKKTWPIWVGVAAGVLAVGAAATVAGVLLTRPAATPMLPSESFR